MIDQVRRMQLRKMAEAGEDNIILQNLPHLLDALDELESRLKKKSSQAHERADIIVAKDAENERLKTELYDMTRRVEDDDKVLSENSAEIARLKDFSLDIRGSAREEIARLRAEIESHGCMKGQRDALMGQVERLKAELAALRDDLNWLRYDHEPWTMSDADRAKYKALCEQADADEVADADEAIITVQDCPDCKVPMAETITGTGYLHTCPRCGKQESEDMI